MRQPQLPLWRRKIREEPPSWQLRLLDYSHMYCEGILQSTCAARMACSCVEGLSVSKVDTVSFHRRH